MISVAGTQPAAVHVTVIGCVERSQPDATATGTTVLEAGQTRYVLTNATVSTDGARTADAVAASVSKYRLDDAQAPMLAPHVDHKVEVSGAIEPPKNGGPAAGRGPALAPLLQVERVRSIAGSATSCASRR